MKRRLAATAAALFFFVPLAAGAQIIPGTELTGYLDQSLSSNHVYAGQTFTLRNVSSSNNNITGATIYGHVASFQKAGQGTPGKISFAYDKLATRAGNTYRISGNTVNVQVNTKSNAGKEAGAGAGGALIGGLIGGGWGALIGGGAGFIVAKNNRQNIEIPQAAAVTVRVTQSSSAYR